MITRGRRPSRSAHRTRASRARRQVLPLTVSLLAAGALAAMVCLLAMRDGVLPPTINLTNPDPECDLDHVTLTAREASPTTAIANKPDMMIFRIEFLLSTKPPSRVRESFDAINPLPYSQTERPFRRAIQAAA